MLRRANWRNPVAFLHDVVAAGVAWSLAYLFRLNFELYEPFTGAMLSNLTWLVPLQAAIFLRVGMYRGLWRYASLPDLRRILIAAGLGAMAIAVVIVLARRPWVPRSVILLYPILLAVIMGGSRVAFRAWKEGHLRRIATEGGKRVIILGAGTAAANLLNNLGRSREWNFVGLLDDDPAKRSREIQGVKVLGTLAQLPEIAAREHAELAVIAMPDESHGVRRRAVELCRDARLPAMTVPSYEDLVSGNVTVSQLRRVELDDLLGRDPVELDSSGLGSWLRGRVVLVTGAGGSIGAELCRQVLRFEPARLLAFEASELALYSLEQELGQQRGATRLAYCIGDVRNAARVDEALRASRPSVIFHAAAYKHVPLMEENAWEALQNNALGTWRVAEAATRHGVEKFVLVSTDKAVNPTNVMGASKRLAELLCQGLGSARTRFVAVRFGNVLGSTGSVIPKFRQQIAAGGPVTVTHPEIRRYFMSIPEAAQLVLQAGLMGQGGEIFVLDMGEPVRIVDLAHDLIRLSGLSEGDIKIVFTGLRPGEKLYEELLADDERTLATPHPKLRIMKPEVPRDRAWVHDALRWLETAGAPPAAEVRAGLGRWVPEYAPAVTPSGAPAPQPAGRTAAVIESQPPR